MTNSPLSPAARVAEIILARLGQIRAGRAVEPTLPLTDLEPLAREYLARRRGDTLADTGVVYVTLAAAREYGAQVRVYDDEQARRELTEILADAKPSANDPRQWRARSGKTGLDVSAIVKPEGRLMIVTSTNTRDLNVRGRRG